MMMEGSPLLQGGATVNANLHCTSKTRVGSFFEKPAQAPTEQPRHYPEDFVKKHPIETNWAAPTALPKSFNDCQRVS